MSRKVNNSGQFKVGNAGGPGRPRREVEVDYLAALSDAVPVETWRKVCERAAKDAENGDAAARAWLGKHLLGEASSLTTLASSEREREIATAVLSANGLTAADICAAELDERLHPSGDAAMLAAVLNGGGESLFDRARRLRREKGE